MPRSANVASLISGATAVVLGGAFVITMAGSQFFATTDFCHYIRLPDKRYIIEPIDWVSALSCAYVMVFSRGSKIYVDTYQRLTSNMATNNSCISFCNSYSLPTHILNVLGILAGGVRGALLGFLGSLTLLHAVRVYNLKIIYAVAIYVSISNSVAYSSFMVSAANKNTEHVIKSLRVTSFEGTFNPRQLLKNLFVIGITLIALLGAFSYFNYASYNAFIQIPYLDRLNHDSAYDTVAINTGLTIIVGGLAKGLQFYRYLTGTETKNAEELAAITSAKIKAHFMIGAIYILFYVCTFFIGLMNTLKLPPFLAIPLSISIALCSGLLEYIFSVRIMVNAERQQILALRTEQAPLLGEAEKNKGISLAKCIQFFRSACGKETASSSEHSINASPPEPSRSSLCCTLI